MENEETELYSPGTTTRKERMAAVLAHAMVLVMDLVPLLNVVLIYSIWGASKGRSEFAQRSAMEALNFNLVWTGLYLLFRYQLPGEWGHWTSLAVDIWMAVASMRVALYASQGKFVEHVPHLRLFK